MAVKIVKSVARVLEILELFNEVQEPMAAVDVATRLDYPLASTHEILKIMVELGFFTYGEPKWTYMPSVRFTQTVEWVKTNLASDANILSLMEALNEETRETINLSKRDDLQVKILRGLECQHEIGVSSKPGTIMNVTKSLTGIVALAHLSETELASFWNMLKQRNPEAYKKRDLELITLIHRELKVSGYSMQVDVNINGIGAVCCPIISSHGEPYVLGIVGPSHRIRENKSQLAKALKTHLRRHSVKTKFPI